MMPEALGSPRRFPILRYFSITSLVAFTIVLLGLGGLYRYVLLEDVLTLGESQNVALAQVFANSQGPRFASFVKSASGLNADALRRHSEIERLREAVLANMKETTVAKIKIYSLDGMTLFSSDEAQIGEDQSHNPAFLKARSGRTVSRLVWRDAFHALDFSVKDRHLIFSYIPLRQNGSIEAVLELYCDVTSWFHHVEQTQRSVFGVVFGILTLLYLALFAIVKYEQRIVDGQHAELRKLSQAVEQSPDSIVITDLQGNIEYVNPRFLETSGYSREEVLGRNSRFLKSGTQPDRFYAHLWNTIASGSEWYGELCNQRKDGSLYWEHVTLAPIYDAKGHMTHFLGIKEDVSAQKLAKDALAESEKRFRKVIEFDADAIIVVDRDHVVRFINPAAEKLFDLHDDRLLGKQFNVPVFDGESTELEIPRRDGSLSIVEIRSVEIEWENSRAYLASLRDITEHKRIEEALRESQQKLENSYQREHKRLQLSDTLRNTSRIVSSTLEQPQVIRLIFDQLEKVITYHRATVSLLEDSMLTLMDGRDKMGDVIKRYSYPAYKYPLNAAVLKHKQPVLVPDVSRDERWHPSRTMQTIRSIIFAPLLVRKKPIGVLAVSRTDEIAYTHDDARTVFAFANQVAMSMYNSQLYARMQERNRRLALLHDISLGINSTLDLTELLNASCRKLVTNFQSDHSAVILFDAGYTSAEVTVEYPGRHAQGLRIPIHEFAAAQKLIATRQPLAVFDARHDPLTEKVWPILRTLKVESLLIVPLVAKDRVIGSFSLDITSERRHFEDSEIETAQTIASQLAVAIENARWLERERTRLEEELSMAWHIQTSLLPGKAPDVPGLELAGYSQPARRVGGDFYNYFPFEPGHLGIAIGDVSGKGMQAAIVMALSVGLLSTKVRPETPPSELLKILNQDLHVHTQRNWMNTALGYLCLRASQSEKGTWKLCVANAGLIEPFLLRRTGEAEWLRVRGLPLGMMEGVCYEEFCTRLHPGDVLFLSSDGVLEAANRDGDMYGAERLSACIASAPQQSAEELLRHIEADVSSFVGDAEAADDMTMVIVVVRG